MNGGRKWTPSGPLGTLASGNMSGNPAASGLAALMTESFSRLLIDEVSAPLTRMDLENLEREMKLT